LFLPYETADGVGNSEDEQSLTSMRRADFTRAKQTSRSPVAHSSKVGNNFLETEPKVSWDVLQKHLYGFNLANDTSDMWPEVSGVVLAAPSSRDAERLARIPRSDDIHDSTPASAIKGCEIVPDRSLVQAAVRHARRQDCSDGTFPLTVSDGTVGGSEGEMEAEFESANPGT